MDFQIKKESQLITYFADQITAKIVRRIIKDFQKLRITLLSDDSGLVSTWDEICVQIQEEYSFYWNEYEVTIENYLKEEVKNLNEPELFTIWLQTDIGFAYDEEEDEIPDSLFEDILEYLKRLIFEEAGKWSNSRIRKYLG